MTQAILRGKFLNGIPGKFVSSVIRLHFYFIIRIVKRKPDISRNNQEFFEFRNDVFIEGMLKFQ